MNETRDEEEICTKLSMWLGWKRCDTPGADSKNFLYNILSWEMETN